MVRVALLGAGAAGERHARALRALDGRCVLVGVHDADPAAAERLASVAGAPVATDPAALLAEADAAVVAGALEDRHRLAATALELGVDALVEPPAGPTPDDARRLLGAIVRAPRRPVLAVGHADHFDPTVRAVRALVADQQLVSVELQRLDPATPAGTPELDVVCELMLADLQIAISLAHAPVAATQAAGRRVRRSGPIDHAQALLVFDDDLIASLTASRAGGARVRRLVVATTSARVVADLDTRTIEATRTVLDAGDGAGESIAQCTRLPPGDAHLAQAEAFLQAVERRSPPEVGLGVGLECHELALAILKRIGLVAHRPALRPAPHRAPRPARPEAA